MMLTTGDIGTKGGDDDDCDDHVDDDDVNDDDVHVIDKYKYVKVTSLVG